MPGGDFLKRCHPLPRLARERLLIPGVEITKNYLSEEESAHVLLLDLKRYVSADLGWEEIFRESRVQGTAGGWGTSREAPGRSGEVIDLGEEILCTPIHLPVSRPWKPHAGRIYSFPVRTLPDEK